jgi:carbonic anhydrase
MTRFTRTFVVALGVAIGSIVAVVAQMAPAKHWAYETSGDAVGPSKWGTLPGNEKCATGKQQAPINLSAGVVRPEDLPNLEFEYKPSRLSMINNGHTIQMKYDAGSRLALTGRPRPPFRLAELHFHAPSEHQLSGQSFPMEAHLVHVNAGGTPVAVVGVFIEAGEENAGLATAFERLPAKSGARSAPAGATIDARALLPADKTFYTYPGSLTTPPCTEGLTWYVLKEPIEMSAAQIGAFTKIGRLAHTNRPLQIVGSRAVLIDSTPAK